MEKFKRVILLGGMGLAALGLASLFFVYYIAPALLEDLLRSRAEDIGLKNARLSVSRITPHTMEMARLSTGPIEPPSLEIAHADAAYSPSSLLQQKLKEISITGLKAHVRWDGTNLFVEGLQDLTAQSGEKGDGVSAVAELFRHVDKIRIHASSITVHTPGQEIPLLMEGYMDAESSSVRRFSISSTVAGSTMTLEGKVDFSKGEGEVEIADAQFQRGGMGSARELEQFPDFFFTGEKLLARGHYQLETGRGSLEMSLPRFQAKVFHGTEVSTYPEITVEGNLHSVTTLQKGRMEKTEISLNLETLRFEEGALALAGKGNINLAVSADYQLRDIQAKLNLSEVLFQNTPIALPLVLNLSGETAEDLSFSIEPFQLPAPYPVIFSHVSGNILNFPRDPQISGQFSTSLDNHILSSLFPDGRLKVKSPYSFTGNYSLGPAKEGWIWKCNARGNQAWGLATLETESTIGKAEVNITAEGTTSSATGPSLVLHLSGEALLPLDPGAAGKRPSSTGLPLRYFGEGKWSLDQGFNFHFKVPKTKFSDKTTLGMLHPGLSGWKFLGGISASGDLSLTNGAWKSGGTLEIEDAEIHSEKPKVSIVGINSKLIFEDLLHLVTPPDQRLQFKKLAWGEVPLTDGEFHLRLEGTRSLFLEKGEFVWCEGRVFANAARVDLDKDDFTLLLYCDKVNLSRMLNFMVHDISAEGKGGISGIIPLQISKGKVTFKEGFLYSTPGDTGMIKIKETEVISGGNVLLEEAIKDFSYDWVKVRLDSRGENLNMVVNLNGTPNRKLPLTLDPETKSFKRDEKGEAGVNLQGLHLELRFNEIPLDELLQKGKYFKGLFH